MHHQDPALVVRTGGNLALAFQLFATMQKRRARTSSIQKCEFKSSIDMLAEFMSIPFIWQCVKTLYPW